METLIYIIGGIIIIFALISLFLYCYIAYSAYVIKERTEKFFQKKVIKTAEKIIDKKIGNIK